MRTVRTFLSFLAVNLLISVVPAQASSNKEIAAITIPSADVTMSFVQPGIIAKILVKEGDKVNAKQLLIQQDTEAAEASLAQKKVDLKRLELIASRGSATDLEVEHARLEVKLAQIYLDNLCLKSPIEGTIDKIDVEVSEAVKGVDNVVRVVKTDPLWIDVPLPLAESRTLKTGQKVEVKFLDYEKKSSEGTVIYISTAADAASSTLRVRIEVPNKSNRPSGEHVRVVFSNLEKT